MELIQGIEKVSYAGAPEDYSAMYITKKVDYLLDCLRGHTGCLVFTEKGIAIPSEIEAKNTIRISETPSLDYAQYVTAIWEKKTAEEAKRKYVLTEDGYYLGENVQIGENAYIEPGVLLGHNVIIGNNCTILAGAVIKKARIGHGFICNENATIGGYSFTMTVDKSGNKYRIPTMGSVAIGNNVEIGAHNTIAAGSNGKTQIDDYVKLDSFVYIAHDVHLHKNVELTSGVTVGGFANIRENVYVGMNATIRNRITIGRNAIIGMGATVTKSFEDNVTLIGNPARVKENLK